jgi:membrane-associated protein
VQRHHTKAAMENLGQLNFSKLIDIFLHLDKYLAAMTTEYGGWVYALLFLIIFVETGLVVMPFLPGDSLLFVAGAIAGLGGLSLTILIPLLIIAAVAGDALNYSIGRYFGDKVFSWEDSRFFNKEAFNKTHAFYEKHGPMTIIVARFLPFIRTFAPFVGGVGHMAYPKFAMFNIIGGCLWVGSLTLLGYLIGNTPWVQQNFSIVTLAMIIIPGLPAVYQVVKIWLGKRKLN